MVTPSDKQVQFIQSLVSERTQALATDQWRHVLSMPMDTVRQASDLITVLKTVPTNPVDTSKIDPQHKQKIDTLRAAIPTMTGRDLVFATSLVDQFDRKGTLSDKQWPYVDRMLQSISAPAVTFNVGDIVRIGDDEYVIFVKRRQGEGTYAKLLTEHGTRYVNGLSYRAATGTLLEGDEKAAVAARFGIASGQCCFCSRALSTKESLHVGYGPDCASKYGLPWGHLVTA